MTAISVVSICFGIVGTVAALVFGLMNISRNKKKDDSEEGWQGGTLFSELGYIKGGVDDIKRKQEKQDEHYLALVQRMSQVESSAKQAHKRIDTLEKEFHDRGMK